MECVRHTLKTSGFFGLYRGLSALLFFSVPKTGTRFGAKEFFDANVFKTPGKLNTFMAGACAGAVEAIIVVTP
jgi:solute carrier family 25 citrate transporter 1